MKTLDISTPILKQNQILQVDYFGSKIISTSKVNFKSWQQSINPPLQQDKLLKYFEKQQYHNQKYYRFKKLINEKYFKKQLPQGYRNKVIAQTIKDGEFLYSPTIQKLTQSMMFQSMCQSNKIQVDNSVNDFLSNFQTYKSLQINTPSTKVSLNLNSDKKSKKSKSNLSRYWIDQNFPIIQEQEQFRKSVKFTKKDTSIFQRTNQRAFTSFSKSRPISQSFTRKSQKIRQLINSSFVTPVHPKPDRAKIQSKTQQLKINQIYGKKQRKSILDTISKQRLIKFLQISKGIDPTRKGIFSLDDLTDFQKFQMSFINYMKLKTKTKLDSYAFETKVRPKTCNLQKFQEFILSEFQIDNDSKRKLERIFKNIKYEFQLASRRKKLQKR